MSSRPNLDMDALRTFVAGFELGTFARAADRLRRSQSAVSTQLHKLEGQVGQALVQKAGRGLALTTAGESLISYARRILELNDEAVDMLRASEVEGWVRMGLPQDFAEIWLPSVLGRFARAHPRLRVEVRAERNTLLVEKTARGELDLSLAWGDTEGRPHAERLAELPVRWIGRADWGGIESLGSEPLPLVAFEQPCVFRAAGIAALDEAGIPWRLVFTSPSLAGLWAAAEAGLGITLRTRIGVPKALATLDPGSAGLPSLPTMPLSLHQAEKEAKAGTARLAKIMRETITERIGDARGSTE
jgi:DNA-binding transcriptional LysR family regulator